MKNKKIDTNLELQHLIEHIKDSWENVPDLDGIMTLAWRMSLEKTKHMFDQYGLLDVSQSIEEKRKDPTKWKKLPKEEIDYIDSYDAIYKIGYDLLMTSSKLERLIMRDWNYSNVCSEIESAIKAQYDIKKLKPQGWLKLSRRYSEYDGMEDFNQDTVDEKFKGIDSGGAASAGFTVRTSLPQVMYDDKEQGRKPFHTLVGAIVGHAYKVSKKNTTLEMIDNLNKLTDYYLKPEFFKKIILEIDTTPFVTNNTLKALFSISKKNPINQEEFDQILKDGKDAKQKFEALSPEDKKSELDKKAKEFEGFMKKLSLKDIKTKEEIAQEKQKENEQHALCMSILNGSTKKKAKP